MTEDQLEQETLAWLQDVGYIHRYGPDIAFDGSSPERADYRQVVLPFRLREAVNCLNPGTPVVARSPGRHRSRRGRRAAGMIALVFIAACAYV